MKVNNPSKGQESVVPEYLLVSLESSRGLLAWRYLYVIYEFIFPLDNVLECIVHLVETLSLQRILGEILWRQAKLCGE